MPTKVLIVDDHPSFRSAARLLLEHEGFEVIGEAENGEMGIERTTQLHPDIVLLDVNLPDLDGFDVATRITKADGEHLPKIVLTSSRDPREFGPLVGASGASGFVPKGELSAARINALLR
ncbi:MAG TPA: response regulator transcription factor [Baekduia sp.]|uniref:response regulator n=1 Tax=Baekduia sp. TaxID=2600305 RepID=UPI002D7872D0|nr:response regulator transcription factor [Baekduia sp.]HET6506223.1 response regulator transcription factor [Baekduia sp.]